MDHRTMAAFGFLFAARQMSSPIIFPKRCLDVVAALAGLFVVAPLFLLIAGAIKFEDGGPIFATRATKRPNDGRGPALLEFRTTSLAATGGYTRVGRLLWPGHLDLLPILINVLRGDTIFLSGWAALTLIFPFLALSGLLVFLVMRS
jgi:lipopolysaccharide/colanic/teichoic acid biosynthesis glycosyltransferase